MPGRRRGPARALGPAPPTREGDVEARSPIRDVELRDERDRNRCTGGRHRAGIGEPSEPQNHALTRHRHAACREAFSAGPNRPFVYGETSVWGGIAGETAKSG